MKIEDYDTPKKCREGIEHRAAELEHLRPFLGWHFHKSKEYRKTERNLERLRAKLRKWGENENAE